MLTLSLLRHAKSDWSEPGKSDFDRALAARGRAAAPKIAAYMAAQGVQPQLVLCSAAVRTRQTLDLVLPHLKGPPRVLFDEKLYLAPPGVMLARLKAQAGDATHVLMVGHDPGMHELAVALAEKGDPAQLRALAAKFPTAGLAVLRFDAEGWDEVGSPTTGRLEMFVRPKQLD